MRLNRTKKLYIVACASVAYVCTSTTAAYWGDELLHLGVDPSFGFDRTLAYLRLVIMPWEWLLCGIVRLAKWQFYFTDQFYVALAAISSAILTAVTTLLVRRWERLFLPIAVALGFLTVCWTYYLIHYFVEYARVESIVRMEPSN